MRTSVWYRIIFSALLYQNYSCSGNDMAIADLYFTMVFAQFLSYKIDRDSIDICVLTWKWSETVTAA